MVIAHPHGASYEVTKNNSKVNGQRLRDYLVEVIKKKKAHVCLIDLVPE